MRRLAIAVLALLICTTAEAGRIGDRAHLRANPGRMIRFPSGPPPVVAIVLVPNTGTVSPAPQYAIYTTNDGASWNNLILPNGLRYSVVWGKGIGWVTGSLYTTTTLMHLATLSPNASFIARTDPYQANNPAWRGAAARPSNGQMLIVGPVLNPTNIAKSLTTSDGITFTAGGDPPTIGAIALVRDGPDALWLLGSDNGGNRIESSPTGATWTSIGPAGFPTASDIATNASGSVIIVPRLTDGTNSRYAGGSWTTFLPGSGMRSIAYGNGVFVGISNTSAYRSTDDGATWSAAIPLPSVGNASVRFHPATGKFYVAGAAFHVSSDNGQTWTQKTNPLSVGIGWPNQMGMGYVAP